MRILYILISVLVFQSSLFCILRFQIDLEKKTFVQYEPIYIRLSFINEGNKSELIKTPIEPYYGITKLFITDPDNLITEYKRSDFEFINFIVQTKYMKPKSIMSEYFIYVNGIMTPAEYLFKKIGKYKIQAKYSNYLNSNTLSLDIIEPYNKLDKNIIQYLTNNQNHKISEMIKIPIKDDSILLPYLKFIYTKEYLCRSSFKSCYFFPRFFKMFLINTGLINFYIDKFCTIHPDYKKAEIQLNEIKNKINSSFYKEMVYDSLFEIYKKQNKITNANLIKIEYNNEFTNGYFLTNMQL
jgi:hypothetical protein